MTRACLCDSHDVVTKEMDYLPTSDVIHRDQIAQRSRRTYGLSHQKGWLERPQTIPMQDQHSFSRSHQGKHIFASVRGMMNQENQQATRTIGEPIPVWRAVQPETGWQGQQTLTIFEQEKYQHRLPQQAELHPPSQAAMDGFPQGTDSDARVMQMAHELRRATLEAQQQQRH